MFVLLWTAVNVEHRGLVGGHEENFADVDVGWAGDGKDDAVGDVVPGEGHHALVDLLSSLGVAMEAHIAKFRFHKPRFNVGHPDRGAQQIEL